MKSEHRHELKTNELADWIAHFPEWASRNRNMLLATAAILLLAVVVYFWRYYHRDVVSARQQTRLTNLVWQVQQQTNNVARAAMQNDDQSYVLLPVARDLEDFAQSTSDNDVAALALLERADALRAELHYRLAEIGPDELSKQVGQARDSFQQALNRAKSNPTLTAMAQFGLGLCEEDLGNFDKAGAIYREVAEKPEYAGTTAQAAAVHRLGIMDDLKSNVVFKPAPPPQAAQPPIPTIQIKPGDANAPAVVQVPARPSVGPVAPSPAPAPSQAPAPAAPAQPAETNKPAGG